MRWAPGRGRGGRVEGWRAGRPLDRATFPVPSTSHAASGFPALRAPTCFTPRGQPGRRYFGACNAGEDSHRSICEAVRNCRAFLRRASNITPERIERAIADDVEFLKA